MTLGPNPIAPVAAGMTRRWSVVVEGPDGATFERALELDSYAIGRDEACVIRLPARDVSRRHALLERGRDGFWSIIDQSGRLDTYVNGACIEAPTQLISGDVVHIGAYRLELRSEGTLPKRNLLLPPPEQRKLPPPPRVRIYEGPLEDRDVRLDRGVVTFAVDTNATVPLDGRRFTGVRVVIRPRKEGGFEVVDQSDAPSLTVNGRPKRQATLGLEGEDVVLGIGPVERQRRDINDAFEVRYMTGERSRGQHTPPPANIPPVAAPSVRDTLVEATPTSDDTLRMEAPDVESGQPDTEPDGADHDASDTAPDGFSSSLSELVSGTHRTPEPSAAVQAPPTPASERGRQVVYDWTPHSTKAHLAQTPTVKILPGESSSLPQDRSKSEQAPEPTERRAERQEHATKGGTYVPEGQANTTSGLATASLTTSALKIAPPPLAESSQSTVTTPPKEDPVKPALRPGVTPAPGEDDADDELPPTPQRSWAGLGVGVGVVAAICLALVFWLWPKQAPEITNVNPPPGPTVSDVRATTPGPTTASPPERQPTASAPERASETPPVAPPPSTARTSAPRPLPPSTPSRGQRPSGGDNATNSASTLQKKQCLLRGGVDCTPAEPTP